MSSGTVAAVDLGASGGRVIVGHVGNDELRLEEIHRFPNEPVALPDGLHWDVLRLYQEILDGLRAAGRAGQAPTSVGIDSWGVDFALIGDEGGLIGNPYHYRDSRHAAGIEAVHDKADRVALYEQTGIQFLPFNSLYQLAALPETTVRRARTFLLMPDLFGFWLTGRMASEPTNASTTGLFDARARTWADALIERLALVRSMFPDLAAPGTELGPIRAAVSLEVGLPDDLVVVHVGSHDTASAVVAVPAVGDGFAYISCGTWSLVGLELDRPVLTEDSRQANFTNEAGVDGRVRYLRNVMGLWLLQESMRSWERIGPREELAALLRAAEGLPEGGPVIDPDDPVFLPPGDMPARIEAACRAADVAPPRTRAAVVRCILDSLADAYARTLDDAARLSGTAIRALHIVGGGARNELLCQLTADRSGLTVLAGPVEATAIGNILVQARARQFVTGDLDRMRALVRSTQEPRRFEPTPRHRVTLVV